MNDIILKEKLFWLATIIDGEGYMGIEKNTQSNGKYTVFMPMLWKLNKRGL